MAHLLLQYCDGTRSLGQFGSKTVPETVKSGILLRNFQPSQDRLQTYFTTLSRQRGCVPLRFAKSQPLGWGSSGV
jgi:hypothetical protein